jgi:hypothetical protein
MPAVTTEFELREVRGLAPGAEDFQFGPAIAAEFLSFRILELAFRTFHGRCPLQKEMPFVFQ